jgi:hypothetical protein
VGFVIVIVMANCAHFAPNCFDQPEMVAMHQFEKFNAQSTQKIAQMRTTWQRSCTVYTNRRGQGS